MAIIYDETYQEYHERPAMRQSTLKHGRKSMLALRHAIDNPGVEETTFMRVGKSSHCLLDVGPDRFADYYAVMPDFHMSSDNCDAKGGSSNSKNTKWYRARVAEWAASIGDREIVSQAEYDKTLGIVRAIYEDPVASHLVKSARYEVTLTWEWNGVPCKARLDMLGDGWWADVKTTDNVELHAFGRKFANMNYDFQCGFYWMGLAANGLLDYECKMITVESERPHDVAVVPIDEHYLAEFAPRAERVLGEYARALESDSWPGVARGQEYELYVPNWAMPAGDALDWSE